MVKEFVNQVLEGQMTLTRDAEATISARIAQIDRLISLQLNEVLHIRRSRSSKEPGAASSTSLTRAKPTTCSRSRCSTSPRSDLLRTCSVRPSSTRAPCSRKSTKKSSASSAARPFAALVGDYEFGRGPEDIELLERVGSGRLGGACAVHVRSLARTAQSEQLSRNSARRATSRKIFDTTEYAKWKSFRQSDDSRYVALTLPHILMRLPYGKDTKQIDAFDYEEAVDGSDHSKYLWGNAAYGLAARLTNSFAKLRLVRFDPRRGRRRPGRRPAGHNFRTDEGDVALKCPTEVAITDRREKELADQGLVPLVHCKGTDYAAFFSVQTVEQAEAVRQGRRPTPTRSSPRSCRTFWPCRDSRIT